MRRLALVTLLLTAGCGSLSEAQRIVLERRIHTLGEVAAVSEEQKAELAALLEKNHVAIPADVQFLDPTELRAETTSVVSDTDAHLK